MSYPKPLGVRAYYIQPGRVANDGQTRGWEVFGSPFGYILDPALVPGTIAPPPRGRLFGTGIPIRWGKSRGFGCVIEPTVDAPPPPMVPR
jgi:hypothetical protein